MSDGNCTHGLVYRDWKGVRGVTVGDDLQARTAAMLRRLEWALGRCPCCEARKPGDGTHYDACDLATLLRDLP